MVDRQCRTYTSEDQQKFARLSGDFNPIHIDETHGKRSIFGGVAVHGIHVVLAALEHVALEQQFILTSLRAVFYRPVLVGVTAEFSYSARSNNLVCVVESEGVVCSRIQFSMAETPPGIEDEVATHQWKRKQPDSTGSMEVGESLQRRLAVNPELAAKLFPKLTRGLLRSDLATLLSSTYIIGMRYPGLHSVFSEVTLNRTDCRSKTMSATCCEFDHRFKRVEFSFTSNFCRGSMIAFVRPAAICQPALAEVGKFVDPQRYRKVQALIIGGSRGLGELIAKILVAGGGRVCCTYVSSRADAQRVQIELGSENCEIRSLDVTEAEEQSFLDLLKSTTPTHVFYLATPHIFGGQKGRISARKTVRFFHFYVSAFLELSRAASALGIKNIFAPSTVAIEECPDAMAEYVIAKSAFESACRYLLKDDSMLNLHFPRLPRLQTDQTVSISSIDSEDTLPTMLKVVADFVDS